MVKITCEICGKERDCYPAAVRQGAKYCSAKCSQIASKGKSRILSEETKKKISENHSNVSGENNPNWMGGKTKGRMKWTNKNWKELANWRKIVLERDGNKCKQCGSTENLEVHHIVPVAETRITALLPMNGVTLCFECHKKTDNFGGKIRYKSLIEDGIGKTKAIIRTIPSKFQAYDTLGNWNYVDDVLVIFVNELPDEKYESLIILHEFIEAILCKHAGIKPETVDEFDANWHYTGEPGDDPNCPYRKQHQLASSIEMLLCHELGLNWHDYNAVLNYLNEVDNGKE